MHACTQSLVALGLLIGISIPSSPCSADILGVRAISYHVTAQDLGDAPDFDGFVVDLFLVSDDPSDTNLNVWDMTLNNSLGAPAYYQSLTAPGWTPSSLGKDFFEPDAMRFADSFVSMGGRLRTGRPVRHQDAALVQMLFNGTMLDPNFGGEEAPVPGPLAGWANGNPSYYIGQPVGGLVFIGRFAIQGAEYFELHGQLSCTWNNGLDTEAKQLFNLEINSATLFLDCNENGVQDNEDIQAGLEEDCNQNGVPDACELAAGLPDLNKNGIPDECEQSSGDLDLDGAIDGMDFAVMLNEFGTSGEFNHVVGDLNDDGSVAGNDIGVLLSLWTISPG